jgi:hypothetical protein
MKTREHRVRIGADRAEEKIRRQAYFLWQQSGCPEGHELDHWLAAKEIIQHRIDQAQAHRRQQEHEAELQTAEFS